MFGMREVRAIMSRTSEDDAKPPAPGSVGSRDPQTGDVVTTAQVFSGRGARALGSRYDYDEAMPLQCDRCGWTGPASAGDKNFFDELFDISCPKCDAMLLIVPYPTDEETKQAAAAGNEKARQNLATVEARERRWALANQKALTLGSKLPDVVGDSLCFVWDLEEADDETWTVIRCGEETVWRELAFWEGWERFNEVKTTLKKIYGPRFARLKPASGSEMYLYGDAWMTAHLEET
jgi:hypothetical protein